MLTKEEIRFAKRINNVLTILFFAFLFLCPLILSIIIEKFKFEISIYYIISLFSALSMLIIIIVIKSINNYFKNKYPVYREYEEQQKALRRAYKEEKHKKSLRKKAKESK